MDVDGNGSDELVFADTAAVHDGIADDADSNCTAAAGSFCGEVYVYQVAGNSGALGAPPVAGTASPAALLNVIRGHGGSGSAFGSSLGVVSEGGNEYLVVAGGSNEYQPVVISGIAGSGITPALYPSPGAGALVVGDFTTLGNDARGRTAWNYSAAMVPLGNPRWRLATCCFYKPDDGASHSCHESGRWVLSKMSRPSSVVMLR